MVKTPILSDHDKRKVFSAKKKQKVVLKNLLVQPFERFWPELSPTDVDHFVQMFRRLHKSSSSDNSKTTTNTKPSSATSSHHNVQKNVDLLANKVILGLRSSIRCVSSGKTLALFISTKIRPRYIVDQVIIMAATINANSKIFCVPDMDVALLDILGFSCQCLAILDDQNEIWDWSVETAKQFVLPKSLQKFKPSVTEQMDIDVVATKKPAVILTNEIDVSTLHLRKENANDRAFIPKGTTSRKDATNDFIALGGTHLNIESIRPRHQMISKDQRSENIFTKTISRQQNVQSEKFSTKRKMMTTHNKQFQHNKVNYLPLKVNRVHANPDKIRNKNKKKNKKNKK